MTSDVPAPRKHDLSWQPPESKWAGRALFFGLGFGAYLLGLWLIGALGSAGLLNQFTFGTPFAVPAALAIAVVLQRIRHGPNWRWLSFLVGVVLLPFVLVGVFVLPQEIERAVKTRTFDAAAWAAAADPARNRRVWMVDDLLARHPLVGRTRAEVVSLLGEPDEGFSRGAKCLADIYSLGTDRSTLWNDREFLTIDYDRVHGVDRVVASKVGSE